MHVFWLFWFFTMVFLGIDHFIYSVWQQNLPDWNTDEPSSLKTFVLFKISEFFLLHWEFFHFFFPCLYFLEPFFPRYWTPSGLYLSYIYIFLVHSKHLIFWINMFIILSFSDLFPWHNVDFYWFLKIFIDEHKISSDFFI